MSDSSNQSWEESESFELDLTKSFLSGFLSSSEADGDSYLRSTRETEKNIIPKQKRFER